jgi:hypothetical protein
MIKKTSMQVNWTPIFLKATRKDSLAIQKINKGIARNLL